MGDTAIRLLWIMKRVPRAPSKVSASELREYLRDLGYAVSLRTVQRDLDRLSNKFPLVNDEPRRPLGWSWDRDAPLMDIPDIDMYSALAFKLAADNIRHLMPAATTRHLEPYFKAAGDRLDRLGADAMRSWPDKVRILPDRLHRVPPEIDGEVMENVQQALFEERRLKLMYRRRGAEADREYEAVPLGLVYHGSVGYLVCTLWDYDDPVQFALHRIKEATILDEPARAPDGFTLDGYIESGAFGFLVGEGTIALKAVFAREVAPSVVETPLSEDQRASVLDDGRVMVEATVADTAALRRWLLGCGPGVEVIEPPELRDEIAGVASRVAAMYGPSGTETKGP